MYDLSSSIWQVLNERTTYALREGGQLVASLALAGFAALGATVAEAVAATVGAANRAAFGFLGIE